VSATIEFDGEVRADPSTSHDDKVHDSRLTGKGGAGGVSARQCHGVCLAW
jgi:hypothetical protein